MDRQARIFVADHAAESAAWGSVSMQNLGAVIQWDSGERLLAAMIEGEIPEVVFVSDALPDVSALSICRKIAANPDLRKIPVIIMGSRDDDAFLTHAIDAGATDVLLKPLNPTLLRARLRSYVALSRESQTQKTDVVERSKELEEMVQTMREELEERERTMSRAEFLFSHDLITGLPNRRQFLELMERGRRRADRNSLPLAVIALGMDDYSALQASDDKNGFDRLLASAGKCIQQALRPQDFVARIGEDMFAAVLMPADSDDEEVAARNAQEVADRASTALLADIYVDGKHQALHTRSAVAVYPRDGLRGPELLKFVEDEIASSRGDVKHDRRRATTPDLASALALELRLRQAIESDRLVPYYQPKVDYKSGKLLGCESLVRWPLRSGEYVGPSEFVPVAEAGGLIPSLDDYVLTAVCCQIAQWQEQFSDFRISVNLSALKLHHRGVFDRLRELFSTTHAKPQHLELEITESALITDFDAAKSWLTAVREMGVTVALDDFGTGYSSLAYLRRLPLDAIKIDQSFIANLEVDRSTVAIVRAMISMANALNMQVVAEGVETRTQAEILTRLGCKVMQGFIYSPAVPASVFEHMLTEGKLELRASGVANDPGMGPTGKALVNPFRRGESEIAPSERRSA